MPVTSKTTTSNRHSEKKKVKTPYHQKSHRATHPPKFGFPSHLIGKKCKQKCKVGFPSSLNSDSLGVTFGNEEPHQTTKLPSHSPLFL